MSKKLEALRAEMKKRGIGGFFVPRADEFQGEYVPPSNERLAWITGFTGSAGYAVVLDDKAAFFTDGRYTLQAREEVDAESFELYSVSENQPPLTTMLPAQWIGKNLGKRILGIDPWIHTPADTKRLLEAAEKAGGTLKFLDDNPLDAAWKDRPAPPMEPAVPHPLRFSGKPSAEKRAELAALLKEKGARALAVTLPEEICWLFNVRGNDVPHTPFVLSYALAHDDGTADWFVDPRKVPAETRDWAGAEVRLHPLAAFAEKLAALAKDGVKIWLDPGEAPVKAREIILQNGGECLEAESPLQLAKARKNETEIEGMIRAHIRDGVAETRFLAAILAPGAAAEFDEISASDLLEKFRSEGEHFRELSFETISGAGPHGAVVHYRATERTKKPLLAGPVYLFDSGAQYLDGTTDITRTVAVDPSGVTAEMRDRFTRVLKGHIAIAAAVFPEGTTGSMLDARARAPLREIGLDFSHGTGHGVGSYLSVHEGPQRIDPRNTAPLEPGMVVSNEPGYYKAGEYGIRIESLVLVIDTGKRDAAGKRLFGFRVLSQAPIDRNLIDPPMLTKEERAWLDTYHAGVRETLMPLLKDKDPAAAAYLDAATRPLQLTIS